MAENGGKFAGKRALVTGSGKGIGRGIALELARQGAEVIALTRTQADLDSLVAEQPNIIPICLDVCSTDDVTRALTDIGDIDLLVNNAGVGGLQAFGEIDLAEFDRVMAVNLRAPLHIAQIVTNKMIASGKGGSIVNMSSQASTRPLAGHTTYAVSKAGLDMMTKSMASELGRHQIRVNSVNPTVVLTELGRKGWSDPAKSGPMLSRIPLGRFGEVDDVVKATLFLLGPDSTMISGQLLFVDGGFICS